ncbi:bifunctional aspartate transaminase/aspartate 4-decarboxylase [Nakamurella deserti]|uniref:bifunctional aspartate transaminase/aspartate 4-decarboxylase n=1 Tax=Nakamurella deserti TaxID=2164074 RepID=UPI000DBE0A82|nr:bifunctional aspartate transaminase/aspartate 4-decarboxylase [Nakamurella deserti]
MDPTPASATPFTLQARVNAAAHASGHPVIDAGRGQPNWTAVAPRAGFFRLGQFAVAEAAAAGGRPEWGEMPSAAGIADRLTADLAGDDSTGAVFLAEAVRYAAEQLGFEPDAWVHELVRAVLGFGYPSPTSMLTHLEKVAERYLLTFTGSPVAPSHRFRVFATEGGAAAMTYVFKTLLENRIVGPGDAVAIATPTFTPYLQIPVLQSYGFTVVDIDAAHNRSYRFDDEVLLKLLDPRIKVFFVINPGNPDSRAMRPERLEQLRELVETRRPDLLIVVDTAYSTFVEGYRGITAVLPRNVVVLHSFSKNFAGTGNRVGFLAVHEDSVADEALAALPDDTKDALRIRYAPVTADVDNLSFLRRLVADSREVALHNIAGLATPDQVQMTFFELAFLMPGGDAYVQATRRELARRMDALMGAFGVAPPGGTDSMYYAIVDVLAVARARRGDAFADRLEAEVDPGAVALRLATDHGVIVQPGSSFRAAPWDLRLSLASLTAADAAAVGTAVLAVVDALG